MQHSLRRTERSLAPIDRRRSATTFGTTQPAAARPMRRRVAANRQATYKGSIETPQRPARASAQHAATAARRSVCPRVDARSGGLAVVHIEGQSTGPVADFDARGRSRRRRRSCRPRQPSAAGSRGARVEHLRRSSTTAATSARGIKAPSAAAAARSWLAAHKQLFRLRSVWHLRLRHRGSAARQPRPRRHLPPGVRRRPVRPTASQP